MTKRSWMCWCVGLWSMIGSGCSDDLAHPTSMPDQGGNRAQPPITAGVGDRSSGTSVAGAQPTTPGNAQPMTPGNAQPTAAMEKPPASAGQGPTPGTAGAMAAMAGNAASSAGSGGAPGVASATLLPVDTTDGPGPYTEIVKLKNVPPGGWLIYPKNLGMGGVKHPIFLWAPGAGTGPDTYDMKGHYDRWVSYGFVVYSPAMSTGDGSEFKAGLDWLLKENDNSSSPVYQKLDTTKIAAGGHSQGSITTFAFASDPRLTTTLHISGGSFDGKGPNTITKPTAYICGGADTLAMSNCSRDYDNTTKVPVYFALMDGVDHVSAAREAWAPIVAWLRWHLAGEEKWKKEFLEPTGKFQTGKFKAMVKNW